jgi:hypothetical protein
MKQLFTTLLFILCLFTVHAQTITPAQLTGKWLTDSVEINMIVNIDQQSQLEELKTQFSGVTFVFNEDGSFYMDYPPCKTATIFEELFPLGQKTEWVFYEENASVTIGTSADNYSIMGLTITKEGAEIFFEIDESYIKVRVTKL